MIFYFTGTGNSRHVAQMLGKKLSEKIISINEMMRDDDASYRFLIREDEHIILVFPIYSWGVPVPIRAFIEKVQFAFGNGNVLPASGNDKTPPASANELPSSAPTNTPPSILAVATCGDFAGDADKQLKKLLAARAFHLAAFYTVSMPNCYILMQGFDVDSDEKAQRKIDMSEERVDQIVTSIREERGDKTLYSRGSLPWLKTNIIYPAFMKNCDGTKFHATEGCNHCTLCEKLCPMGNITLKEGVPQWGSNCVQCLACIHHCPKRAIEYANATQNKGRYYFKEKSND